MKKLLSLITYFLLAASAWAEYVPSEAVLKSRQDFAGEKFGIFLHWGLYSTFAQGEWYMQNQDINRDEYAKVANAFYPHSFDARAWVKAFKAAGAKYITFTSRHHEGFSMWDSKASAYNIMHTPYGRDIIRQLADACHEEDIALHLYYSHIDWTRDDYPTGRTGLNTGKDRSKTNWRSYYDFMNAQLTELLTQYGPIRCIWFDGWWDHDKDSTAFNWELPYQYELIHRLQPACMVANNHHQVPFEGEDIQIFERDVPGENTAEWNTSEISRLPLETCQTMNGMWGYKIKDQDYKSPRELIQLLVRTSGKGANLLLNIGPQPDGNLPATALSRLEEMGKWLGTYGETIYGTTAGPAHDGEKYVTTRKGSTIYLHLLDPTLKEVQFPFSEKVVGVKAFAGDTCKWLQQKKGKKQVLSITTPTDPTEPFDRIYVIEVK